MKGNADLCGNMVAHLSLDKDAPHGRPVQPLGSGEIVAFPQVGGLHYRYERLAA